MKVTIQDSKTSVTVRPRDFKVTVSGARGPQGDAGVGIAAGGAEGQILAKASATDYDTEWIDNYAVNVEVYVKNSSGSPMTKGQVVYISGADGTNPTISLAIATSEMGSSKTIGWLKQDLVQGAFGYVITEGLLEGINTNSATAAGDPVWLSPTTAGGVVYGLASKPSAPNHLVFLGYVLRKQTNNGKVYVKVQNGFELGELHDVYNGAKTTPVASDALLLRDSADSNLWKRLTWTNALAGVKSHMDTFKSVANGYASLDGSGKVPSSELPSYVDDVVEVANYAALPGTGETGKIYVTLDTNKCYRWAGSVYVQVAQGVDTLTTTGTSGAATLVGSTLNIPQYQGVLTNPVTGTGTAGQVAYFNGTSAVTGSANLFWDNANGSLGIGTNAPTQKLEITAGNIIIDNNSEYRSKSTGGSSLPILKVDTSNNLLAGSVFFGSQFISYTSTSYRWYQYPGSVLTERMQLNAAGNLLIQNGGTFTDNGQRLQVYGSTLLRGSGTTSATTALLVQNSTPTNLLQILDNGRINQTIPGATNNTIFGTSAGASASLSGANNAFYGHQAGTSNTSGADNSFFGKNSGVLLQTGSLNCFFGVEAGRSTVSTSSNNFFGKDCGYNNSNSSNNSFFGTVAGRSITNNSNNNSFFGNGAGYFLTTDCSNNVITGYQGGIKILSGANLTQINNSVLLGYETRANANSETNQIVIGYQAIGNGSNTATLGNTSITATYLRGNINYTDGGNFVIGTTTGTKIGTATSQKLSFWNATPVAQPTTGIAEAAFVENSGGTAVNVDSTFAGYTIQQIAQALKDIGLLA